jgi:3-dehydroquinate synthase
MPDNIHFSANPSAILKSILEEKEYSKVCVLADENTFRYCYPLIKNGLKDHEVIKIVSGEERKNMETCISIWQSMTAASLDRHAVLIVLGGGVLGDMGGFCAATYKRGIDFILIPTTLLAQVDASIGGKLGVDFNHFKNHIGVFQSPASTILDSGFLKTLPVEELRSGFAEVIKHTLISDKAMWAEISGRSLENQDWEKLIRHSVDFKLDVVSKDPKEKGLRKILNAGHTIGHAIESHMLNKGTRILHGQAIAAGLVTESYIASEKGLLLQNDLKEIVRYMIEIYGKINVAPVDDQTIAQLTIQDKKNKGNKILCVLLEGIGKARWDCEISQDEVKGALSFYRSL